MKLTGTAIFHAPVEVVWKALLDPVVLAAVMPGCEKLELVDGQYIGELNIKVGPVQGKFTGKIDLLDLVEHQGYRIKVDGRGAQGFVQANAQVTLEPQGADTKITYDADATIGGKVATVGQRLLETSAKAIIKQSLDGLDENVKLMAARSAPPPVASTAAPLEPQTPPAPIRVDQNKLAVAVAREVTKSLIPPAAIAVLVALALFAAWWIFSRSS